MYNGVATSFYVTTERALQDIRAMDNNGKVFSSIPLQNEEQEELYDRP